MRSLLLFCTMRVFILENHLDTLMSLKFYIESLGHQVITATSLVEAMEKLKSAKCDVVFSDIGLPDGTGWELIENGHLKPPVFAVAMSGFGMREIRQRSIAAGFRHHLVKPITPEKIDQMLAEAEQNIHKEN